MALRIGLPLTAVVAGLVGAFATPRASVVYAPTSTCVTHTADFESKPQQVVAAASLRQDDPTIDPAIAARARRIETLTTGLKGTWRLVRLTPTPPVPVPRQVSGLMVVTDHVLSITVHALPDISDRVNPSARIQGGAHYWRIGPLETLEMAAILGHDNLTMELALEPQLEPREYHVDLLERRLSLRKRDGSTLEFERMDVQSFPPQAMRFIDALRQGRNLDDLRNQ